VGLQFTLVLFLDTDSRTQKLKTHGEAGLLRSWRTLFAISCFSMASDFSTSVRLDATACGIPPKMAAVST